MCTYNNYYNYNYMIIQYNKTKVYIVSDNLANNKLLIQQHTYNKGAVYI